MTLHRIPANDKTDWLSHCQKNDKKVPIPNLFNAALALREAPEFKDLLAYDEMTKTATITQAVPDMETSPEFPRKYPSPVTDLDVTGIQEFLQKYGLRRISRDTVHQAVDLVASEKPYHPVKAFLRGLQWDGENRLGGWLNAYLGAPHGLYTSQIGTMFLLSMVARIFHPGCKCRYMLVLEGEQGAYKSTACEILAGEWFSDSLPDIHDNAKDAAQHLRGKWLVEWSELAAAGKADVEHIKAFIDRKVEQYRPPYGRRDVFEPRQCVFIGTTNQARYLKDETGGTRFWPVTVGQIDLDLLRQDRDQLFAEAVHRFNRGEPWYPDREFEDQHIRPQQEARFQVDEWAPLVLNYAELLATVSIKEIAIDVLGIQPSQLLGTVTKRIADILRANGWKDYSDGKARRWRRQRLCD